MKKGFRFTGVGGQGVLTAGRILAEAKISSGGYSTATSTYTSQVRGGPTKMDVMLSDEEIIYPYVQKLEFMLSVAQSSFNIYKKELIPDSSIVVIDKYLVKPTEEDYKKFNIKEVDIINIAQNEVKNILTQSSIALGITVAINNKLDKNFNIDLKILEETLLSSVPAKHHEKNKDALKIGIELGESLI